MNTFISEYGDGKIRFKTDDNGRVWINATQMAKMFPEKDLSMFYKNPQVQEIAMAILEEFSNSVHIRDHNTSNTANVFEYLKEITEPKGPGDPSQTWLLDDLAIELGRWLDPRFGHWCNKKVKELLSKGMALISDDEEERMRQLAEAATRAMNAIIAKKAAEKLANDALQKVSDLETRVEKAIVWHNEVRPIVDFAKNALDASDDQSMMECARLTNAQCLDRIGIDASMSRNEIFKLLRRLGVVMKGSSMFYQQFSEFFSTKMTEVNGKMHPTMFIRKEFLHRFINMLTKEAAKPGSVKSFRKEMGKDDKQLSIA